MRRNPHNEGHERTNCVDVVMPVPSAPLSPVVSYEDIETVIPNAVAAEEQDWYDWQNVSTGKRVICEAISVMSGLQGAWLGSELMREL